jgi:xanthine dehydrogenase molybdenum-binding subunit
VDKEGKILARQVKIIADNGAYSDKGTAVINSAAQTFATLYNPRALKYDALIIYTNKSCGTAFRGMGNPQAHFAVECQMDKIARLLKLDPKELRLRNCHYPDQETYFGPKITSCAMKECIEQASQLAGWERKEELKTNCAPKGGHGYGGNDLYRWGTQVLWI